MRAFRSFLQHLLANPPPEPLPAKEGFFSWFDNIIPGSSKEQRKSPGKDKGGKSARVSDVGKRTSGNLSNEKLPNLMGNETITPA